MNEVSTGASALRLEGLTRRFRSVKKRSKS